MASDLHELWTDSGRIEGRARKWFSFSPIRVSLYIVGTKVLRMNKLYIGILREIHLLT